MQQLQELANARSDAEKMIAKTLENELAAAEQEYTTASESLVQEMARRRRELENAFARTKSTAAENKRRLSLEIEDSYEQHCARTEASYKQRALAIERKKKESEWQALAVFDASKDSPQQMLDAASKTVLARRLQVDGLHRDANTLMAMRHLSQAAEVIDDAPVLDIDSEKSADEQQQENLSQLRQEVLRLQAQRLPSLMLEGYRFVGWWLLLSLLCVLPSRLITPWSFFWIPLTAIALGSLATGAVYLLFGRKVQRQSLTSYTSILSLLAQARQLDQAALTEAETKSRKLAEEINMHKHQELSAAQQARDQAANRNEEQRQAEFQKGQAQRETDLEKVCIGCNEAQAAADEKYPPLLDQLSEERVSHEKEYLERWNTRKAAAQQAHDAAWQAMADRWQGGFQDITSELAAMKKKAEGYFPDWSKTTWEDWQRPTVTPPAFQFGECVLPLHAVKNGVPEDPRLVPNQQALDLPALMNLTELPGMVITTSGVGRSAAVELMQAMMLRFLTAMPAGKLRFTIIDPSALGENFASYMHLADYDEQLVGGQIWTDMRQIDEKLSLLSDHMEKVLQKYLRNEFDDIHQYNEQAGEVAEPYHVLVLANFPVGLSDSSMRKLVTISKTGPRCGVYTLISIDESRKLPNDFDPTDLFRDKVHLQWLDNQLRWNYPLFEKLPLELDVLPPREKLNELLQVTGKESFVASKVEVPFAVVAPDADEVWSGSTSRELVVPMGRAGANDLQSLRLGRGTAQHALISGKTGSGKSTLLHAMITNLALHYSPSEVEFYLVDFKKGVEFKAYSTGQLPHARVIAIESEREFGVSVLERLDQELRQRGELFRSLGVQDLAGARNACDERLPRVLLIIDEFQELFVTDDKLAQDSALLLDRLVRQGRAFGIHVLLGSQTLAGAYSLARSTIGQMAVRIALECSEADSHLILSDENMAARLLSRPGEAIYNDQNGLVEGNNLFQVVWLSDQERQRYLAEIREQQEATGLTVEPAIVFEGNIPADPCGNEALINRITNPATQEIAEPTIWVGAAVRIEPPTQLMLRRQGGNNLIVLGQEETLALGVLGTGLISLASQFGPGEAAFTVVDGTRPESAEQGAWQEIAAALPGRVDLVEPRNVGSLVSSLNAEVTRRSENTEVSHPPHFLIIHDLAQIRQLRQTEDDFGFSFGSAGKEKEIPVDKQFRDLLREGPAVGVHVIMWCDSHNTLSRFLDRLAMREVDYRVALQMSVSDSTSFIDSPAAGRLGENRAILYRDDLGTQVKFRPYRRPTKEWLEWVAGQSERESLAHS